MHHRPLPQPIDVSQRAKHGSHCDFLGPSAWMGSLQGRASASAAQPAHQPRPYRKPWASEKPPQAILRPLSSQPAASAPTTRSWSNPEDETWASQGHICASAPRRPLVLLSHAALGHIPLSEDIPTDLWMESVGWLAPRGGPGWSG